MFRCLARSLLVASLLLPATAAFAHDSWISRGGHRNTAGEWCCGEGDCFVVPNQSVGITGQGYQLYGSETVPFGETQPSRRGLLALQAPGRHPPLLLRAADELLRPAGLPPRHEIVIVKPSLRA